MADGQGLHQGRQYIHEDTVSAGTLFCACQVTYCPEVRDPVVSICIPTSHEHSRCIGYTTEYGSGEAFREVKLHTIMVPRTQNRS